LFGEVSFEVICVLAQSSCVQVLGILGDFELVERDRFCLVHGLLQQLLDANISIDDADRFALEPTLLHVGY